MWRTDDAWKSWFAAIPDVDLEAAQAFTAAIDSNLELGSTPAERQQRLATARSFVRYAKWANLGLFAWTYLFPRPYQLLILVLSIIPWAVIVIMARSPGLYTFNAPRGSDQPDLTVLLISPGFLLTIRALMDVQTLDWQRLIVWTLIIALLMIGTIWMKLPAARAKLGAVVLTFLLLMAYGYGTSALANALLDRSPATSYTTQVYGKHITSGRNRRPEMRLGPWGARTVDADVMVSWDLYRSTNIGDPVCVLVHPGALRISWYRVAKCPLST